MATQPEINQYRLIKLPEVEKLTGKSRSAIYSDPSFPRPVKLSKRASAFVESEVYAWIESRIAEREKAGC
tara:strand:- start:152 stop:361 length:210 start_codon:yes stop_codon:yes gene_type:complete